MSYQVIARKYRPQSFDQMVGQNHITQTIHNALKNNRLPHALLFTGLRGTGKTSSARILAKILRCTELTNFTPCNQCQSCIEISLSKAVDVIEIDGASNNGVDAIRDLRDNVMFSPSSGKYKIFIIDEVHMLSTSAFNALLKTLEEPPAHIIFILATTEVHKIPQTILSRCQRFDFRRISLKSVTEYLKKICELEKITSEPAALWLIAKQGEGSMRDSLSLLDQVISFTDSNLTEAKVGQVLGLTERSLVFEVFNALLFRHTTQIIALLEKLIGNGQNETLFLEELLRLTRHSLLLKADSKATDLIDLPEDEVKLLVDKIQNSSEPDLHMLFDMLLKASQDVSRHSDPQIVLEIALLRISQAPKIKDLKNLLGAAQSSSVNSPSSNQGANQNALSPHTPSSRRDNSDSPKPQKPTDAAEITKPKPLQVQDISSNDWLNFVEKVKIKDAFFSSKIESLLFLGCKNLQLSLQAPANLTFLASQMASPDMKQKLQGFIDSELGEGYTFEVLKDSGKSGSKPTGESAQSMAVKKIALAEEELLAKLQTDPRVQKAQQVFKGEVRIVKKH